jgi:hypothetical protein
MVKGNLITNTIRWIVLVKEKFYPLIAERFRHFILQFYLPLKIAYSLKMEICAIIIDVNIIMK